MQFTVFTPTYNRAYTLKNAYQSLLSQTFTDFEWIIVDDGSTDDTESLVKTFITDKFKIIYKKIPHAGKHFATNVAYDLAQGELFLTLDSDDTLYNENTLQDIFNTWTNLPTDKQYDGIWGCFIDQNDEIVVQPDSEFIDFDKKKYCDYFSQDALGRINVFRVYKTEVIKTEKYPTIDDNLTFFPECIICLRLALNSNNYCRLTNKVWYRYNRFRDDSVSENIGQTNATPYENLYIINEYIKHGIDKEYQQFINKKLNELSLSPLKFLFKNLFKINSKKCILKTILYFIKNLPDALFSIHNKYNNGIKRKVIKILGIKFKIKVKNQ